ncbi:terminase small subunit [Pelagibacter phage HTVC008M]|uniref:terminase small subunit n=1 Tax=Pelagibacter phage HTVC008M TaxID=1283076 RepID=UPI0002B26CCD|nr:terminase small subunit [Pelagibacter phage HTVC008M]AGE60411.1 terminase small subunit [Pelagibacter phage HTVC008M]
MKKVEDKLNELLDITETKQEIVQTTTAVPRPNEKEDITSDYKYSRENLYNLVERGQDAIDGILTLAKETDHPRTYEVAGQLIKNVGEVTEKLLQLQEKMKKLGEETKKDLAKLKIISLLGVQQNCRN